MLRVAVPNKGQLAEPARSMLIEAGYLRDAGVRDLVVHDPINDVEFFVPEAEFATIILDLAAGDVSEESLARWIRDNWPK